MLFKDASFVITNEESIWEKRDKFSNTLKMSHGVMIQILNDGLRITFQKSSAGDPY